VSLEKRRAEAIGTRTGVVIHGEEGNTNLVKREGGNKRSRLEGVQRGGSDKGSKLKDVGSRLGGAEKIFEKRMENGSFRLVRKHRIGFVVVKDFDLVLPQAPRGTKVEISRVFVAEGAVLDFGPLPPVGGPVTDNPAKLVFGKSA
jgi:hypothetical protein